MACLRIFAAVLPLLLGGCVPDALRFEDYPASPGRPGAFVPTRIPETGLSWKILSYMQVSADEGEPDFAGHLRVFAVGCGTGCMEFRLIDRSTGEVLPGGEVLNGHVEHRRDSRLLVTQRSAGYGHPIYLDYWVWDGKGLQKRMTAERREPPAGCGNCQPR